MEPTLPASLPGQPSRQLRGGRVLSNLSVCVLLGLAAACIAVVLGGASNAVVVAGVVATASLCAFVWLRGPHLVPTLVVGGIALSIPVNLDVNLFYRMHVGGAPSITINLTVIGLVVFYAVWAYRHRTGQQARFIQLHLPIALAAVALLALTPLSLVNADYPELVWLEWIRLLLLVLAMVAVMSLQDERLVRLLVFVLSVQVVIQAGLAGAQYVLKRSLGLGIFGEDVLVQQNIGHVVNRATGTIGHPNVLSYFFEIMLPVLLALTLTRQPPLRQLWYGLAFAAGIGGVLTTLSRGAWLTIPVSVAIVVVAVHGHRIVRARSLVGAFLLGCALLVAAYFAYPTIYKRFTHSDYKSAQSRMPLNRATLSIVEQFPVTGIGLNNFGESFKRYDRTGFSRIFRGYQQVVHNLHLWILAETGFIGYFAYMAPFAVTMAVAWRTAARAPPVPKAIVVGIAAGLLAHLMHGMLDPGFRVSLAVSFLLFVLMGVVGALALQYPARIRHER